MKGAGFNVSCRADQPRSDGQLTAVGRNPRPNVMHFVIEVKSVAHLADVISRIRRLAVVQDAQRV